MALRVAHGTYTGDGNDDRNITVSPSFVIKFVIIKHAQNDGDAVISISGMGDQTRELNDATASLSTDRIQSMGTGTFQVGSDLDVNGDGGTYYYFCLGGDDTEIVASSYSGDDTDDRQITTSFLPEAVLILQNASAIALARFGGIATDQALSLAGIGGLSGSNRIQNFNST